jgi:hypothetical protein
MTQKKVAPAAGVAACVAACAMIAPLTGRFEGLRIR